jgi:hypothetical protein
MEITGDEFSEILIEALSEQIPFEIVTSYTPEAKIYIESVVSPVFHKKLLPLPEATNSIESPEHNELPKDVEILALGEEFTLIIIDAVEVHPSVLVTVTK